MDIQIFITLNVIRILDVCFDQAHVVGVPWERGFDVLIPLPVQQVHIHQDARVLRHFLSGVGLNNATMFLKEIILQFTPYIIIEYENIIISNLKMYLDQLHMVIGVCQAREYEEEHFAFVCTQVQDLPFPPLLTVIL